MPSSHQSPAHHNGEYFTLYILAGSLGLLLPVSNYITRCLLCPQSLYSNDQHQSVHLLINIFLGTKNFVSTYHIKMTNREQSKST